MATVAMGNFVTVHYTGRLESGEVFDSSEEREPLKFVLGRGTVIPGFEKGMIGMAVGEERTLDIPPADGFGERDPKRIARVTKEKLGESDPKVGMHLQVELADGTPAVATVKAVEDLKVLLDLNHPLSGQVLQFKIRVLDIQDGKDYPEEEPEGCDHHGGECCGNHGNGCCG